MNKLLILVLAVCLVSAHAFVKRDAPTPAPQGENYVDKAAKQFNEIKDQLQKITEDVFNPQKAKEAVDSAISNIQQAIESLKPKETPKE